MKFSTMGLGPDLLEGISKLGFETPTPVQAAVIPAILNNRRDLVALAQTGTGKTAAFGLPILQLLDAKLKTPQALILCPTRELCMQIARDLKSFSACSKSARILAVFGGADIKTQISALNRGVDIVVATPGRMVDLLRRKRADFSLIRRVVLDEADEMLNMGFEEDLQTILSNVPDGAQTLLFSATMPRQVASIASQYMKNPEEITIGARNVGTENVRHEVLVVHAKDRYRALKRLADYYMDMYGLVFCRTRQETQNIADHLSKDGYRTEALHGDLSQAQRDRVMKRFRAKELQMLVATDVAARGLDVNNLTHVINYSLPDDPGAYTHRSGRTGRAGKTGVSIVLINMREHGKLRRIEKQLGREFIHCDVPTGNDICKIRLKALMTRLNEIKPEPGLIDEILPSLCKSLKGISYEELLRRFATLELQRLLDYYRNEPDITTEAHQKGGKDSRRKRIDPGDMVKLCMNVGKINKLTPKQLINLVNAADRKSSVDIGHINITNKQSYFDVPAGAEQKVIDSFAKTEVDFEGRRVSVSRAGPGQPEGRGGRRRDSSFRPKRNYKSGSGKKQFRKKKS